MPVRLRMSPAFTLSARPSRGVLLAECGGYRIAPGHITKRRSDRGEHVTRDDARFPEVVGDALCRAPVDPRTRGGSLEDGRPACDEPGDDTSEDVTRSCGGE